MDGEAADRGEVRPVAPDQRKRSRSPSSRSQSGDRRRSHSAKRRKEKRRRRKKKSKKRRKEPKAAKSQRGGAASEGAAGPPERSSERPAHPGAVVTDEQKARIQAMRPMTKEEWEARQSVLRHVVDPETGRKRLIKGDGEVLEENRQPRETQRNKQACD
ncbi:ADP-ribosylation factor-like protein 6-interacting protein 4 [Pristis pectinata]|uniref:ADP-ribosylation factor-like protein 6-interacting protein 4 n=1 Tax=Pristis pectinata TaxID=685728 RepID=UPI00223DCEE9|nr:ADP-ribosylation factor-like protein 6-interacting protein 4 [Pristis pectinata]